MNNICSLTFSLNILIFLALLIFGNKVKTQILYMRVQSTSKHLIDQSGERILQIDQSKTKHL